MHPFIFTNFHSLSSLCDHYMDAYCLRILTLNFLTILRYIVSYLLSLSCWSLLPWNELCRHYKKDWNTANCNHNAFRSHPPDVLHIWAEEWTNTSHKRCFSRASCICFVAHRFWKVRMFFCCCRPAKMWYVPFCQYVIFSLIWLFNTCLYHVWNYITEDEIVVKFVNFSFDSFYKQTRVPEDEIKPFSYFIYWNTISYLLKQYGLS